MLSHSASSKQIWAYDFSPPLRDLGSLSLLPAWELFVTWSSVWTRRLRVAAPWSKMILPV